MELAEAGGNVSVLNATIPARVKITRLGRIIGINVSKICLEIRGLQIYGLKERW
jgi:hypothetical protein